jgi:hypothetical protein
LLRCPFTRAGQGGLRTPFPMRSVVGTNEEL